MKTLLFVRPCSRSPGGSLALAALIAFGTLTSVCQAVTVPASPVGTWDCVMSGARSGVVYMTFASDGTFTMAEALVPKKLSTSNSATDRGGSTIGRPGDTTSSNSLPAYTNIFGFETPAGKWAFDDKGRVVGFFTETTVPSCSTNQVQYANTTETNAAFPYLPVNTPQTNWAADSQTFCVYVTLGTDTNTSPSIYTNQTICYSNVVTCLALTNQINFTGKASPGKRLSLVASTPSGKSTITGVPAVGLADFSGNYLGVKRLPGPLIYYELFTLGFRGTGNYTNAYTVTGSGPGYSYLTQGAIAIVSSQNKISLVFDMDPDGKVVRAVTGSFNRNRMTGSLEGIEDTAAADSAAARPRMTFKINHQ